MHTTILPSATGKYVTTCKLCHTRIAESPALEIPIIGHPGKKVEKLISLLLRHLTKHHFDLLIKGEQLLGEFQAFMILTAFEYEDPSMEPRLENIRAAVFALVKKDSLTNESMEHVVAGFGLDPEDAAKVNQAMQAVRDACCELGPHAPKIPEESKIVTV